MSQTTTIQIAKAALDHQHLRVFAVLARCLNMRRASEDLGLTPSGISRCLAMLERKWGCRLFERSSRRMALSRAGRELLPLAEGVLERLALLEQQLPAAAQSIERQLRIAASPCLASQILPAALLEFRETCPERAVGIQIVDAPQASAGLRDERFSLAILGRPSALDGFRFELLAEDDLQFVLHPLHPWAVERRVPAAEIGQRRLVMPDRDDETFRLVDAYFRNSGITIEPLIEVGSEDSIREIVRLNVGIGILPRWVVADDVRRGRLATLPLGRRRLRQDWGVLTLRSRTPDFEEHLFANICGAILRDRIGSPAPAPAPAPAGIPSDFPPC